MRYVVLGGATGFAGGRFNGRRGSNGNLKSQISIFLKEVVSPTHLCFVNIV